MESNDIVPFQVMYADLWRRGELGFLLDSLQNKIKDAIYDASGDKVCILSSRQIGKSYLLCVYVLEHCIRNPGATVLICSATLKQTSSIVNDNLVKVLESAPDGLVTRHKSEYKWTLSNGSSFRMGSLDRSSIDNFRGMAATLVATEEAGFVPSEDFKYAMDSVLSPMLLRSGGREIHVTTPSEDEFHHIHTTIKCECELANSFFSYTVYDSPSITNHQIQKAIDRCGGESSESFKREYLAQIIRSSTLMVIPEFQEISHVTDLPFPEHYVPVMAIDFGGIKDNTGIISGYWNFLLNHFYVWDSRQFGPNTQTREIMTQAKLMSKELNWNGKKPEIWADIPGQLQVDLLNDEEIFVRVTEKTDRDAHINHVRLGFHTAKILLHPRNKMLIGCILTARYNEQRKDFVRTELFGHADLLMALVYAYRMADKSTNPFPKIPIDRDRQFHVPYRSAIDPLEKVAKELVPFDLNRRSGNVRR